MGTWNWKLIVSCVVAFALWKAFFYWDNQRQRSPPAAAPTVNTAAPPSPNAFAPAPAPAIPRRLAQVEPGFLTGNRFQSYPRGDRVVYVMGAIDGFLLSPVFGAPKAETAWLEGCILGMQSGQALAIIEKWMGENPQRWHEPMHASVFAAMRQSCPDRP